MVRTGISDKKALERRTGITYHRLNSWFRRSTAKPSAEDLLVLAKTFDVSEEYLLKGGERKPYPRKAALISRVEKLDQELQDELENYLDYLETKRRQPKSDQVNE